MHGYFTQCLVRETSQYIIIKFLFAAVVYV